MSMLLLSVALSGLIHALPPTQVDQDKAAPQTLSLDKPSLVPS